MTFQKVLYNKTIKVINFSVQTIKTKVHIYAIKFYQSEYDQN